MKKPIAITALASISPLGMSLQESWKAYQGTESFITMRKISDEIVFVASLSASAKAKILELRKSNTKYENLDDTVLYALFASREAVKSAGWHSKDNFGINIGSSRGATTLFEKYHAEFLKEKHSSTLSSPTTTLGNISSWVAHDLQTKGPEISHSITCSTALHALLNGIAWLNAGMADKFLVGGSEAPLTPFTIAQMKALKIYAQPPANPDTAERSYYPCRSLDLEKTSNSMVLGEGAAAACLELGERENALAYIRGVGYATEILEHNASLSTEAKCFQNSMKMALGNLSPDEIDVIVTHTPGTVKGDLAEFRAIEKVFDNKIPFLSTNKWKLGHTFGASGLLSLELAILMLQHQQVVEVPYAKKANQPKAIRTILVNAVGFGGNAVSVLISKY
ncbi:MAG: beta-ketoacyl synthase N-terminal-like domain-containing protein [Flavobacteriaceae bacterium]|nr:beta-ketoacyl synthase N-terminal-like domain-containing protein [Flavobacteriaceae bacterium]